MWRTVKEVVKLIVIAVVIAYPLRYYVAQPFFVRGSSMEPNFYSGEYLIIDELSFRFREPQRGEVVVLRYPLDDAQYFIKRIIGLPGERVEIVDGRVTVFNAQYPEGRALDEERYVRIPTPGQVNLTLGERQYFVLGDNRGASSDSRRWGALGRDDIIGRVWIRAFPFERATVFAAP
ncbi:MAG: signal peptidase I [bacterium]|nr:signal peptidase I [bacterium]MDZ4295847.1 signal peptidase I [Patescibacteria group bacterium]MDZ4295866.1 signal peptidase I [Patescibacteria group bacterium]